MLGGLIALFIQMQPEFFPTTLEVVSVAIIAVIGIGILVFFKKKRN